MFHNDQEEVGSMKVTWRSACDASLAVDQLRKGNFDAVVIHHGPWPDRAHRGNRILCLPKNESKVTSAFNGTVERDEHFEGIIRLALNAEWTGGVLNIVEQLARA